MKRPQHPWNIAVGVLLLGGCGPATTNPRDLAKSAKPQKEETESGRRRFQTGAVELLQRSETQVKQWSAKAAEAELVLDGGKARGMLVKPGGVLYSKGEPVAKFEAGKAQADQVANVLQMLSEVKVVGEEVTIQTKQVSWVPDTQMVMASGGVELKSNGWSVRGLQSVVGTDDFAMIGTPDAFKDKIQKTMRNLKNRSPRNTLVLSLLAGALAGGASAQPQAEFITDKFAVRGWTSFRTRKVSGDRVEFTLSGPNLVAESPSKGFRVMGKTLQGYFRTVGSKQELQEANWTGDVTVDLDAKGTRTTVQSSDVRLENGSEPRLEFPKPLTLVRKSAVQNLTMSANSAHVTLRTLSGKDSVKSVLLQGGVEFTSKSGDESTVRGKFGSLTYKPGAQVDDIASAGSCWIEQKTALRTVTLTGTSGNASMGRGAFPLKSADLSGPVKVTMISDGKSGTESYVGTGNHLAYNDEARKVTLRGNVVLEAKSSLFEGTNRGTLLTLLLNDRREVTEVEMSGDPGTTEYTGKPPKKS